MVHQVFLQFSTETLREGRGGDVDDMGIANLGVENVLVDKIDFALEPQITRYLPAMLDERNHQIHSSGSDAQQPSSRHQMKASPTSQIDDQRSRGQRYVTQHVHER